VRAPAEALARLASAAREHRLVARAALHGRARRTAASASAARIPEEAAWDDVTRSRRPGYCCIIRPMSSRRGAGGFGADCRARVHVRR
jgi:hypothetical protein